jgi:hypothetical protein
MGMAQGCCMHTSRCLSFALWSRHGHGPTAHTYSLTLTMQYCILYCYAARCYCLLARAASRWVP